MSIGVWVSLSISFILLMFVAISVVKKRTDKNKKNEKKDK